MKFNDKEPVNDEGAECPYCGCVYEDIWEKLHNDGDTGIVECECGKEFQVSMCIMVDYRSQPVSCGDGNHIFPEYDEWTDSSCNEGKQFRSAECENCSEYKYERRDKPTPTTDEKE